MREMANNEGGVSMRRESVQRPLLRFPADPRSHLNDDSDQLLHTQYAYEYGADWQYVRTHLANERTFLAWVRTSLSLFGIGYGILKIEVAARPDNLPWYDALIAMIFACGGLMSLALGTQRFSASEAASHIPRNHLSSSE